MTKAEQAYKLADKRHEADTWMKVSKAAGAGEETHQALAEHYSISDPVASQHHAEIARERAATKAAGADRAEHCVGCCEKIEAMETNEEGADHGPADKSEGAALRKLQDSVDLILKQTIPSNVRGVPSQDRPVLVPRTGGVPIDKAAIHPGLEEIILDPNQAVG